MNVGGGGGGSHITRVCNSSAVYIGPGTYVRMYTALTLNEVLRRV